MARPLLFFSGGAVLQGRSYAAGGHLDAGSSKVCTRTGGLLLHPDSESTFTVVTGIDTLATLSGNPCSKNPHRNPSPLCYKISIKNILQTRAKYATVKLPHYTAGQTYILPQAEDDCWRAAKPLRLAAFSFSSRPSCGRLGSADFWLCRS